MFLPALRSYKKQVTSRPQHSTQFFEDFPRFFEVLQNIDIDGGFKGVLAKGHLIEISGQVDFAVDPSSSWLEIKSDVRTWEKQFLCLQFPAPPSTTSVFGASWAATSTRNLSIACLAKRAFDATLATLEPSSNLGIKVNDFGWTSMAPSSPPATGCEADLKTLRAISVPFPKAGSIFRCASRREEDGAPSASSWRSLQK